MNCPKCNCNVAPGLLFCSECGFKIETVPLCRECGASLRDGVLFCPVCQTPSRGMSNSTGNNSLYNHTNSAKKGITSLNDDKSEITSGNLSHNPDDTLERTMTIPVIKPNSHRPSDSSDRAISERDAQKPGGLLKSDFFEGRSKNVKTDVNQKNIRKKREKKTSNKKVKSKLTQTQKNILIFIFVFIAVVLLGLVAISTAIKVTYNKPLKKASESSNKKISVVSEVEEPGEDTKESLSQTEYGSSRQTAVYDPLIDMKYEFARGIGIDDIIDSDSEDEMQLYENHEYSFSCSLPASFVQENEDAVEVRYATADKTAYVDIGALKNANSWSLVYIRDTTIDKLGGTVDNQASGEDWFEVSLVKDAICYYRKCFVNEDTVRYFEIVYPEEYSDVFDKCVNAIGATF